jgi:hypothetical protein
MASKRTFYRTVIQLVVLSETPYNETDINQIAHDITEGDQSGRATITSANEEMNGKVAAVLLKEQGSSPEFFMLDDHGNDIHDDEDEEEDDNYHNVRKMKD